MAWVEGKRYLTVTFGDIALETTTRRYQVDNGYDPNSLTNGIAIVQALFRAVTKAAIYKVSLDQEYYDDAFANPPNADSDVKHGDKAVITLSLRSYPGKKAPLDIPSPAESIFMSANGKGKNVINTENTAVRNLVALFVDTLYISDGENTVDDADNRIVSGRRV